MSTNAPATTISIATNALLRSLGAELNGWLSGIGLTQASDTGQINWTTVTLPAASTAIGYEIWAFPDLSIYFRIDWKTPTTIATQAPVMALTVGTGSNGSGTITGQVTPSTSVGPVNSVISNTSANWTTYLCLNSDVFWIVWKDGSVVSSNPVMGFCIEKTVDSTGTPNGSGYVVTSLNAGIGSLSSVQAVRVSGSPTTFAASTAFCLIPGNITNSTNSSGQRQVFLHQYAIPDVILSNAKASIVMAEAAQGVTLTATLVGTTPQTMISMGSHFGSGNSASISTTWGIALRWQ